MKLVCSSVIKSLKNDNFLRWTNKIVKVSFRDNNVIDEIYRKNTLLHWLYDAIFAKSSTFIIILNNNIVLLFFL